jgi:hypothetical protein
VAEPVAAAPRRSFLEPVELDVGGLRLAGGLLLGCAAARLALPGEPGLPCPLRTLTGVPCPLCGMTTSVTETVRLDLGAALAANPAGVAAVAAAVVLLLRPPRRLRVYTPAIVAVLAAMWVFELARFSII